MRRGFLKFADVGILSRLPELTAGDRKRPDINRNRRLDSLRKDTSDVANHGIFIRHEDPRDGLHVPSRKSAAVSGRFRSIYANHVENILGEKSAAIVFKSEILYLQFPEVKSFEKETVNCRVNEIAVIAEEKIILLVDSNFRKCPYFCHRC